MERRAWLRGMAVSMLVGLMIAVSSPASAVTRWDPRYDSDADVWRSKKNAVVIDGASRLRFVVIATLLNDWALSVYLDTRGDRRADYRLRNFELFGISRCVLVRLPNGDPRSVPCSFRTIDDSILLRRLGWTIPRGWLRSDKVIRWYVHTTNVGAGGLHQNADRHDRAPDSGWYP